MNYEILDTIKKYGLEKTAALVAEYLSLKIKTEDVAMQFVLEEIEIASQGNKIAKHFALNSGFDEEDYLGASSNSFEDIEGLDGPQQELMRLSISLSFDSNLMVLFRTKVVHNIMKMHKIGKYLYINENTSLVKIIKKLNNSEQGTFININNDLIDSGIIHLDNIFLLAYWYASRITAAGAFLQNSFTKQMYVNIKNELDSVLNNQNISNELYEKSINKVYELLLFYDKRLTKDFISKMLIIVDNNITIRKEKSFIYYEDIIKLIESHEIENDEIPF